jgi:hypothetical protein
MCRATWEVRGDMITKTETATTTANVIQREAWLPMISVIQHNCAKRYKGTIAAVETGVECRADIVWLITHHERKEELESAIQHTKSEKETVFGR